MAFSIYLQYFQAKNFSAPAVPMEGAFINLLACAWKRGGHAQTSAPRPSQPRGRRLDNYKTEENQTNVLRTGLELGQGGDAGGWPADFRGGGGLSPSLLVGPSQVLHFQLLVRLVLPGGKQKGQVQKIKLLLAAPTQALAREVSNQTKGTQCSQRRSAAKIASPKFSDHYRSSEPFSLGNPLEKRDCREALQQGEGRREGCD